MKILRILFFGLLCPASFVVRTAEPESVKAPSFIVLGYDKNFQAQSADIVNHLIQRDLLINLNIEPSVQRAAVKNPEEKLTESIVHVKTQYSTLYRQYSISARDQKSLNNTLTTQQPIIIVCDTYSTKILQDTLAKCPDNAIHSVILINPSVNTPLNFGAISHRVYNFYSKAPVAVTDIATNIRKYTPETGGFIVQERGIWSKIVNIRCMYEAAQGTDNDVVLTTEAISKLNIPKLVALADEHYKANWDLTAIIARAHGASNYTYIYIPFLFINRPLTMDKNTIKNEQERWTSERFNNGQLEAIQAELQRESLYNAHLTAPCYNAAEGKWLCPALKDSPYIKAIEQTKPLYERFKEERPEWMTGVEQLEQGYRNAFEEFCKQWISVKTTVTPENRSLSLDALFNQLKLKLRDDHEMAIFFALGTIAFHQLELYNNIRIERGSDPTQILIHTQNKDIGHPVDDPNLMSDPRLYKIHLMPKDKDLVNFYIKLVDFILRDDQLRSCMYGFKVITGKSDDLAKDGSPRIALYIWSDKAGDAGLQESKNNAQIILNKLYAKFKDTPGSGYSPDYNEKATDLIWFAQGNRDAKRRETERREKFEAPKFIYFKPRYKGYNVNFQLLKPADH